MGTRVAIILALGLIIAAFIHGGLYHATSAGGETPIVWRINKFTGSVFVCVGVMCQESRERWPQR